LSDLDDDGADMEAAKLDEPSQVAKVKQRTFTHFVLLP